MPNQLGKRYECKECGTIVLCTKPGTGTAANIECHGKPMEIQQPRQLPSSD